MDTFKGQDNDTFKELCSQNNCEVVIFSHNLTHKFQPLGISVNKAAKGFIQNLYHEWFSNQVAIQLKHGIDPADVKISSMFSDLKPLHASWIVELYHQLSNEAEMIISGFDSARIRFRLVSRFACNTRVVVDASSSPPVSLMSNSCNKTLNQINKQTNLNQYHIINQSNSNSIRW